MFVNTGVFALDENVEKIKLSGNYVIKEIENEVKLDWSTEEENIRNQLIYTKGNVLYRTDTEHIEGLIKLFIRYTHDPCKDLEAHMDFSVKENTQMIGGTICPTKKVLFVYKSKIFVAYGRYIFGYDKPYVTFKREVPLTEDTEKSKNEDSTDDLEDLDSSDSDSDQYKSKIENNEIILAVPKPEPDLYEYVYSFMIYDPKENILDAYGLYR